jgi:hypothetical protein
MSNAIGPVGGRMIPARWKASSAGMARWVLPLVQTQLAAGPAAMMPAKARPAAIALQAWLRLVACSRL